MTSCHGKHILPVDMPTLEPAGCLEVYDNNKRNSQNYHHGLQLAKAVRVECFDLSGSRGSVSHDRSKRAM